MDTQIITKITIDEKEFFFSGIYNEGILESLMIEPYGRDSVLWNIYTGIVEKSQENIGSAFLNLGGFNAYLPVSSHKNQDEVTVQIIKEASGNKLAVASERLRLVGNTAVVSEGSGRVFVSKKLNVQQHSALLKWSEEIDVSGIDVIFRTNAAYSDKDKALDETKKLIGTLRSVRKRSVTAACFSKLYEADSFYLRHMNSVHGGVPEKIITDDKDVYAALKKCEKAAERAVLYEDKCPLGAIYNTERDLKRLLSKIVYLKSGAFLVIEKTEAFISIDVNTGKYLKGRDPEETYRLTDIEAASEAVRQIILRNLSGMILIDFINLKNADHRKELISTVRNAFRKRGDAAEVVDITGLGIMEITRKRTAKSLEDIVKETY